MGPPGRDMRALYQGTSHMQHAMAGHAASIRQAFAQGDWVAYVLQLYLLEGPQQKSVRVLTMPLSEASYLEMVFGRDKLVPVADLLRATVIPRRMGEPDA